MTYISDIVKDLNSSLEIIIYHLKRLQKENTELKDHIKNLRQDIDNIIKIKIKE